MAVRGELITTAELERSLTEPNLRIFDCTTTLDYLPPGSEAPYRVVPGRHSFEAAHVPGADLLDLQGEFSDEHTRLRFMMADVPKLEAAFGRHGVGPGSSVVLYSIGTPMWATRFWWMLKSLGFGDVAVLDGGWDKWTAEGRAVESGKAKGYPPAAFAAKPRAGFFVDSRQVLAAGSERNTIVVNALNAQLHSGLEPSRYGRPGRIPGSCNVSAATLIDPDSKAFVPLADAEAKFQAQGFFRDKRVIAYCGGGISATVDLFMLHRLGYDKLALYDGSMGEWATDEKLPIETG
jgi:thiosulfate/3-mercaptopyruvate sulfurtransferase